MTMFAKSLTGLALALGIGMSAQAAEPGYVATMRDGLHLQANTPSARLNQLTSFLADQLTHNRDLKNLSDSTVAITSFVHLPELKDTSKLGIALQERLMHELQVRGFRVMDFKVMSTLKVAPNGDFVYSRNVQDLRREVNVNYFLTGVVENNSDGFVLHARLIDARSGIQVSSAQAFVPGRDVARLTGEYKPEGVPTVVVNKPTLPAVEPNTVRLSF